MGTTQFPVSARPTFIRYTGYNTISLNLGNIYSASAAYVTEVMNYDSYYTYGIYTDKNNSTTTDFVYYNVMKTADSSTPLTYSIIMKTGGNLYSGTSNTSPTKTAGQTGWWTHTYSWHKIKVTPKLINNTNPTETLLSPLYTDVIEVRQKQNSISTASTYTFKYTSGMTYSHTVSTAITVQPANSYSRKVNASIISQYPANKTVISLSKTQYTAGEKVQFTGGNVIGYAKIKLSSDDSNANFTNNVSFTLTVYCQQQTVTTISPAPDVAD